MIETVVATHFTPLVRDGGMKVALYGVEASARVIDGSTLEGILERRKSRERRDRNSIGPSGRQAWETLETLKPEYGCTIETKAGKVRLHLRYCRELLEAGRTCSFFATACGLPTMCRTIGLRIIATQCRSTV